MKTSVKIRSHRIADDPVMSLRARRAARKQRASVVAGTVATVAPETVPTHSTSLSAKSLNALQRAKDALLKTNEVVANDQSKFTAPRSLFVDLADGREMYIDTLATIPEEGASATIDGTTAKDGSYTTVDGDTIEIKGGKVASYTQAPSNNGRRRHGMFSVPPGYRPQTKASMRQRWDEYKAKSKNKFSL